MPKEIADRYCLKMPPIGEGRFGRVYRAKDYRTSKKVAIKIVSLNIKYSIIKITIMIL